MKIICIGRNYAAHAQELGNEVPKEPLLFIKPPSALLKNNKPFYIPEFTSEVHYEVELVIKICKNGRHISRRFAHRYYEEVSLGIDFTARDVQQRLKAAGHPWEIAKGFDGAAVIGSFIPFDPIWRDVGVSFSLMKNGQKVQQGHTDQMIHDINAIIAHVSQYFKLQMGDYIYTGTPAGVGPVQPGDLLEGYIEDQQMFSCKVH